MPEDVQPAPTGAVEAKAPEAAEVAPANPLDTSYVIRHIREQFDEVAFKAALSEHVAALAEKHNVNQYTVLLLMDAQDELSSWHSNRIYNGASAANRERPILLTLLNLGGSIEAGYLISKTCKRLANGKFVVAVPRKAKSAATLLALGADEIHMGLMSELGPIDPVRGAACTGNEKRLGDPVRVGLQVPRRSQHAQ